MTAVASICRTGAYRRCEFSFSEEIVRAKATAKATANAIETATGTAPAIAIAIVPPMVTLTTTATEPPSTTPAAIVKALATANALPTGTENILPVSHSAAVQIMPTPTIEMATLAFERLRCIFAIHRS